MARSVSRRPVAQTFKPPVTPACQQRTLRHRPFTEASIPVGANFPWKFGRMVAGAEPDGTTMSSPQPAHDIAARGAFMDACKAHPELWKLATNGGALLHWWV